MPAPFARRSLLVAASALAIGAGSFALLPSETAVAAPHEADPAVADGVAVLAPTEGNQTHGTIHFSPADGGVHVTGEIRGLTPDTEHGFHVHEFGDVSAADGTATGGHFNPEGHDHALPSEHKAMHAGDMGNVMADADGVATVDLIAEGITLDPGPDCVLGRGLIVHAKADDGGQPTGNAGARLAQAVIGVAGPEKK